MATSVLVPPHAAGRIDLRHLVDFAAEGLVHMFDPDSRLFYHQLTYARAGVTTTGLSHRYTMMTLLGLHRFENAGSVSPVAIAPVLDTLLSDLAWVENAGDLGLLLWLVAVVAPDRLPSVNANLRLDSMVPASAAFQHGNTMQLAWLLAGLSHACLALPSPLAGWRELSLKCFDLLSRNQGPAGFFGHQATWKSPQGLLRGRIGSFADQVYPIYALSLFAQAHAHPEALAMARPCAEAICRAQGEEGQWCWHYNAHTGNVIDKFPVYSVHQHAMGPMALFALGDTSAQDFRGPILKGLGWIYGNNELGCDMFSPEHSVIWRNIRKKSTGSYVQKALKLVRTADSAVDPGDLEVLYECRPYELGWLLYAFAERTALL